MGTYVNGCMIPYQDLEGELTIAHLIGTKALNIGLELGFTRCSINAPSRPGHGSTT
jgi:hypothetical protein